MRELANPSVALPIVSLALAVGSDHRRETSTAVHHLVKRDGKLHPGIQHVAVWALLDSKSNRADSDYILLKTEN